MPMQPQRPAACTTLSIPAESRITQAKETSTLALITWVEIQTVFRPLRLPPKGGVFIYTGKERPCLIRTTDSDLFELGRAVLSLL